MTLTIEQLTDPELGVLYPRLIAATGRCPPEDCGGPWGYAEFLDAIRDPAHERHAELKEWIGCDFDPDNVDSEELAAHVAMLAKQWARTPATRRTRRACWLLQLPAALRSVVNDKLRAPGRMLTANLPRHLTMSSINWTKRKPRM